MVFPARRGTVTGIKGDIGPNFEQTTSSDSQGML